MLKPITRRQFIASSTALVGTASTPFCLDKLPFGWGTVPLKIHALAGFAEQLPPFALAEFRDKVKAYSHGRVLVDFSPETLNHTQASLSTAVKTAPRKLVLHSPRVEILSRRRGVAQPVMDALTVHDMLSSREGWKSWNSISSKYSSYPIFFGARLLPNADSVTIFGLALDPEYVQEMPAENLLALTRAANEVAKKITGA